jgi:conjugative transfer signal peptidase TraF
VTHSGTLAALAAGVLLIASSLEAPTPRLVWNASPSVPLGLYSIARCPARRGDLVLVRLPPRIADLAARRGYLPTNAYLLKAVIAGVGDHVCRFGDRIVVRGVAIARALARDSSGRPLPVWRGCRRLTLGEVFLLADNAYSFDSRYFGVVATEHVLGRALPLWPRAAATDPKTRALN